MELKYLILIFPILLKLSESASPGFQDRENSTCPSHPEETIRSVREEHSCGCSGVFVNTCKLRVIFDWWLCEKPWHYALTLLGLFGFAMMSPCLKAYREILRAKVVRSYIFDCLLTHFLLFLFALFVYALDFLLMLIVMSFNVGVFLAVTSGYAVGYVFSSMAYSMHRESTRQASFSRAHEDCC